MGCGKAWKNIIAPVSNTTTPAALSHNEAKAEEIAEAMDAKQDENNESASIIPECAEALSLGWDKYKSSIDKLIDLDLDKLMEDLKL